MVRTLFGFSGRLTRLQFLGLTILGIGLATLEVAALTFGVSLLVSDGDVMAGLVVGTGAIMIGLIPVIWANLALATRRLRDAGFPPGLVIPAMIGLSLAGQIASAPSLDALDPVELVRSWPFGLCVQLVFAGVLFLWPSARCDDGEEPTATADLRPATAFVTPLPVARFKPALSLPKPAFGRRRRWT